MADVVVKATLDISEKYLCSITGQIMMEPVFIADGHIYEREAIEEWLKVHNTSPKTGSELKNKDLVTAWDKKTSIEKLLTKKPELYDKEDVIYLPKVWVSQLMSAIKTNDHKVVEALLDKDRRLLTVKLDATYTASFSKQKDDQNLHDHGSEKLTKTINVSISSVSIQKIINPIAKGTSEQTHKDLTGYTSFHVACEFGSPELTNCILEKLIKREQLAAIKTKPADFKPVYLNKLLEKILENKDTERSDLLLQLGADIEQPELGTQNTLLHRFVIKDNQEAVVWLLSKNAIIDGINHEGNTALLLAMLNNYTKLAILLLDKGANQFVMNAKQQTPILIALLHHQQSILTILVGNKKAALPSLHLALKLNDIAILKALLKQSDVNKEAMDEQQRTPFYVAVVKRNIEAARLLIEANINPLITWGVKQSTPLHMATENEDLIMLKLLLQNEVVVTNIDLANNDGDTALHLAAKSGKDDIVNMLIEADAHHKIKNKQDLTSAELARQQDHGKTADLIERTARVLKQAKLAEVSFLRKKHREQSIKIMELEKERAEQEKKIEQNKDIFINHFKNYKKLSQQALTEPLLKTLHGNERCSNISCLQLLPSGELVSNYYHGIIHIWDLKSGDCLKTIENNGNISCLQLLPSGALVVGGYDHPYGTIKIWDLKSSTCLKIIKIHGSRVNCLQLLPNGDLISGSLDEAENGVINIWDIASKNYPKKTLIHSLKTGRFNSAGVSCFQMLSSGELISGSGNGIIKVWDIESGTCLKTLTGQQYNSVSCLQLLPSGELVSGGNYDGTIDIWDLKSGTCLKTIKGHGNSVNCLQLLPNGILISGSGSSLTGDNTIKFWDIAKGACLKKLAGHGHGIQCLQILTSGELISCGGSDGTIKVWNIEELMIARKLENEYPELEKKLADCSIM